MEKLSAPPGSTRQSNRKADEGAQRWEDRKNQGPKAAFNAGAILTSAAGSNKNLMRHGMANGSSTASLSRYDSLLGPGFPALPGNENARLTAGLAVGQIPSAPLGSTFIIHPALAAAIRCTHFLSFDRRSRAFATRLVWKQCLAPYKAGDGRIFAGLPPVFEVVFNWAGESAGRSGGPSIKLACIPLAVA